MVKSRECQEIDRGGKIERKPCRIKSSIESSTSTSFNLAFISHINRSKHVVISFWCVYCVCVYLEFAIHLLHLNKMLSHSELGILVTIAYFVWIRFFFSSPFCTQRLLAKRKKEGLQNVNS